jgi:membrane associated rhomboid family serine protease
MSMTEGQPWSEPPAREPLFRAPAAVLFLATLLIVVHAVLAFTPVDGARVLADYALTGQALAARRWVPLLSYMALHGSWAHVLLNCVFLLAFGAAPARLFGRDLRGSSVFVGFFLTCGVIVGLGFAAIQTDHHWAVVGASGSVAGLMGATARMLNPGGRLGPPWGRGFAVMAISWVGLNALLAFGPAATLLAEGVQVAWQAHIIGFFAGAALVGLFWGLAGRRDPITQ